MSARLYERSDGADDYSSYTPQWLPTRGPRFGSHFATSQSLDPFSRVHAATWRGVMQVDLSMSPCRRMKLCIFFEQAGLALCCEPRKVVRDMPVGPSS
jgi:hypothetical protein